MTLKYPYKDEAEIRKLEPTLTFEGKGLQDGGSSLIYQIEDGRETLYEGQTEVEIADGSFQEEIKLRNGFPEAKGVSWELSTSTWSKLRGG